MPVYRTIQTPEGVGTDNNPFAYFSFDVANRIGNPSAFGAVYKGAASDRMGNAVTPEQRFAIKVARDTTQNDRFQREYEVLVKLAQASQRQYNWIGSPYPAFYLEDDENKGIPAIAMPLYEEAFRDHVLTSYLEQKREADLIEILIYYAQILAALKQVRLKPDDVGYVCLDRKPEDLRWNDGLVVIDWNVLKPNQEPHIRAEISLYGRTWYVLLTGYEPGDTLNPFDDSQWAHASLTSLAREGAVSIGLRAVIAAAYAGTYTNLDEILSDLEGWLQQVRTGIRAAQAPFRHQLLGERAAAAVYADLAWRHSGDPALLEARHAAVSAAILQTDSLESIRAFLDDVGRLFLQPNDDTAAHLVENTRVGEPLQRAAVTRWGILLQAYRGGGIRAEQRAKLRAERTPIFRIITRLQRPLTADWAVETDLPLVGARDYLQALIVNFPEESETANALRILHKELDLRAAYQMAQSSKSDRSLRTQALTHAFECAQDLPYAADLLEGIDLAAALQGARADEQAEGLAAESAARAQDSLLAWMKSSGGHATPDAVKQEWLRLEDEVILSVDNANRAAAHQFTESLTPLRRTADTLYEISFESVKAADAVRLAEQVTADTHLPEAISTEFRAAVQPLIESKAQQEQKTVDREMAKLKKGDGRDRFNELYHEITLLADPNVLAWLNGELPERITNLFRSMESIQAFLDWMYDNPGRSNAEILNKGLSLHLRSHLPPLNWYLQAAVNDGVALEAKLTDLERRLTAVDRRVQKTETSVPAAPSYTPSAETEVTRQDLGDLSRDIGNVQKAAQAAADHASSLRATFDANAASLEQYKQGIADQLKGHDDALAQLKRPSILVLAGLGLAVLALLLGGIGLISRESLEPLNATIAALSADVAAVQGQATESVGGMLDVERASSSATIEAQANRVDALEFHMLELRATLSANVQALDNLPTGAAVTDDPAVATAVPDSTQQPVFASPLPPAVDTPAPSSAAPVGTISGVADTAMGQYLELNALPGIEFTDAQLSIGDYGIVTPVVQNVVTTYPALVEGLTGVSRLIVRVSGVPGSSAFDVHVFPIIRTADLAAGGGFRFVDNSGTVRVFEPVDLPFPTQVKLVLVTEELATGILAALGQRAIHTNLTELVSGAFVLAQVDEQDYIAALQLGGQRISFVQSRVTAEGQVRNIRRVPNASVDTVIVGGVTSEASTSPFTAELTADSVSLLVGNQINPEYLFSDYFVMVTSGGADWLLVDRGEQQSLNRYGWVQYAANALRFSGYRIVVSAPELGSAGQYLVDTLTASGQ